MGLSASILLLYSLLPHGSHSEPLKLQVTSHHCSSQNLPMTSDLYSQQNLKSWLWSIKPDMLNLRQLLWPTCYHFPPCSYQPLWPSCSSLSKSRSSLPWALYTLFHLLGKVFLQDNLKAHTSFQSGLPQMSLYQRGLPQLPAKIASCSPLQLCIPLPCFGFLLCTQHCPTYYISISLFVYCLSLPTKL